MKTTIIRKAMLAVSLGCFFTIGQIKAQDSKPRENKTMEGSAYTNAIGIRFGGTTGFTYKHRFDSHNTMELILGTHPHAFGLTGLYEYYFPTTVEGLNLYLGAGGHISRAYYRASGYYYVAEDDRRYFYKTYGYGPIVGIDGMAGIEYKIPRAPLAISLDMKPYAEFYRNFGPFFNLDPGLGIKFTF
jgi:hypothetical protein